MTFYKKLSEVYELLFPPNPQTVQFLTRDLPFGSRVLDIACGTGGYAAQIAELGYPVEALDLDQGMIQQAKRRDAPVNWLLGDMTQIQQYWEKKRFELIYCIGNSIVHLEHKEDVEAMLASCRHLLSPNGQLIVGIVNFQRILDNPSPSLPTIERAAAGIRFERSYRQDAETGKVLFASRLTEQIGEQEIVYEHAVPLLPLYGEELAEMARAAGFGQVSLYGNFQAAAFDPASSPAVIIHAQLPSHDE